MCITRGELAQSGVRSATFALAHVPTCTTSEDRSESRTRYRKQRFAQNLVSRAYSLDDIETRQ
jgi:hypothetical protein